MNDMFSVRRRVTAGLLGLVLAFSAAVPAATQDEEATPEPDAESELTAQLPLPDLPTMNEQGYVFELESTFSGDLTSIPQDAPVYGVTVNAPSMDAANAMRDRLDIEGEVEEQGEGTYAADGNGSLFMTDGLTQYISAEDPGDGDLPDDEEAISDAREWLRVNDLLPGNIGEGTIEARVDEASRIIVSFAPVQPEPLLSATPSITVTLGPDSTVLETSLRWASISELDTYQLRGAEQTIQEIQEQRAYVQTELPEDDFPPGEVISGEAEYATVSLAYTSSGTPESGQYLQPVFVFEGEVTPEGSEDTFPITAYVPALINSQEPVG